MAQRYNLGSVVGKIVLNYDAKGTKRAQEDINKLKKDAEQFAKDWDLVSGSTSRAMSRIAKGAAIAAASLAAVGASANAVGGTLAAISASSGALGVLPGIALAGAAAIGTLVVGLQGFGEAMKNLDDADAFEEAVAKLAPSAQAAARSIRAIKPAWDSLQLNVQQRLFEGTSKIIEDLGGTYLPILDRGLSSLATTMNKGVKQWAEFASEAQTIEDTETVLDNINKAFEELTDAIKPAFRAMRDIGTVGSEFLPGIAESAADAAEKFADFVAEARRTGELYSWIQQGINTLNQLGRIAQNVFGIISNLFGGLSSQGGGFLNTLEEVTQKFNEFLAQADVQETLGQLGQAFTDVALVIADLFMTAVEELGPSLQSILPAFADLVEIIGAALKSALETVSPMIKAMADFWQENSTWLNPLIVTLGTAVISLLAVNRAITGIMNTVNGVKAAINTFTWFGNAAGTVGSKVGSAFAKAGRSIGTFMTNFAAQVASMGATAAKFATDMSKAAGKWMLQWTKMAAHAVKKAVIIAAAWLAANPMVAVIAAVVAIVAAIIYYWDEIVAFLEMVWNWIKELAATVWNAIATFFENLWNGITTLFETTWNNILSFLEGIWNTIWETVKSIFTAIGNFFRDIWNGISTFFSNIWNSIVDTVSNAASNVYNGVKNGVVNAYNAVKSWLGKVVDWVRQLPGRILNALGDLGSLLWESGRALINGFWEGIKSMFGWVKDQVSNLMSGLRNLWPFSPAKEGPFSGRGYVTYSGEAIMEDFAKAMTRAAPELYSSIRRLMSNAQGMLSGPDIQGQWLNNFVSTQPLSPLTTGSAAMGSSGSTVIGNLTIQVAGNLDPTNPVAWRQAMVNIKDGIRTVEREYA